MPNSVNDYYNIILNSESGEDTRDAIVSLFRNTQNESIGVSLTMAEYKELTQAQKSNGTLYFVSDASFEEGDDKYYSGDDIEANYVLLSKETVLGIAEQVMSAFEIQNGVRMTDVPSFMASYKGSMLVERRDHILTDSYLNSNKFYKGTGATGTNVLDIYPVEAGDTYIVGLTGTIGNRFHCLFFTSDPLTITDSTLTGTQIANVTPTAWATAKYIAPSSGFIVIQTSSQSDQSIYSYCVKGTKFARVIEKTYGE